MKLTLLVVLVCATAPALAVPVSVTVVGPDNKPLPDAKLSSFETKFIYDDVPNVTEQTGVAGVFAWNWDGDFADKQSVGKKPFLRVRVQAPGMASQFQVIQKGQTTIHLQKTRSWSGVVFDPNQKPLAGAVITLSSVTPALEEPGEKDELLGAFVAVENKTAVTDANGRWTFEGLPTTGRATIAFSAPNFASQRIELPLGDGDAAPIYAKPGGAIAGQLLAPDGSPIVGETVQAFVGSYESTETDAQGRFTLDGLPPGENRFLVGKFVADDGKKQTVPPYILERFQRATVEAGKTTAMEPIKAQKGLLFRARVVGADTKKPIEDARFRIGYNSIVNAVAADGTLQSRVLPTDQNGGFDRPKIESDGYVDYDLPINALKTKGDTLDLGTIEMQRGNKITGTIRLESVPPGTKPPSISFSRQNNYDFISPKDDGSFSSKTLEAGSYSVNMNGGGANWEIVSPRTVSLPEAGTEFKPIEVVIKRLTPVLPIIKSATGRVLDENGQGVAGVTVRATMSLENGNTYPNRTALTDKDGTFTIPGEDEVIGVEIQGAELPGYIVGGQTKIAVADNIATITGLVAKKRGAIYRGHVVGANGQPAAKAWVGVVEARDYEPVQTDENGDFALPDVPLSQFTLLAAKDRDWAKQAAQSDKSGATLELQSSQNVADRERTLEQLLAIKGGVSTDKLFGAWDVLGAQNIERYIRRNGEPAPEVMALFGAELGRRDPAQLIKRAPELLGNSAGEARENLEAQLNLARAASDDAGALTDANAWLDEQKQIKREINARSVTQLLQMAAVAQKLKRDDAAQWLDYAAAVAAQLKGDPEQNAYAWSNALAALGFDAITRFTEGYDAPTEFQLLSYMTPILARAGDVAGAQKSLARMETLLADPAMTGAAEQARKQQRELPSNSLQRMQSAVAGAVAPTDPVAAYALAQKITDVFTRARAMIRVGDGAQKAGNAAIAEKALRDVMKARIGNVEFFAQAAAIGARVNAQLGDELFVIAKDKALPKDERGGFGPPSIGAWAFYHAPYDAALSRELIEREWNWRLPAATKNNNDAFSSGFGALYELVHGMAAVDTKRAAEMQTQVDASETKNYGQAMSQFDIAVATLATAEQRERLGVNEMD